MVSKIFESSIAPDDEAAREEDSPIYFLKELFDSICDKETFYARDIAKCPSGVGKSYLESIPILRLRKEREWNKCRRLRRNGCTKNAELRKKVISMNKKIYIIQILFCKKMLLLYTRNLMRVIFVYKTCLLTTSDFCR